MPKDTWKTGSRKTDQKPVFLTVTVRLFLVSWTEDCMVVKVTSVA